MPRAGGEVSSNALESRKSDRFQTEDQSRLLSQPERESAISESQNAPTNAVPAVASLGLGTEKASDSGSSPDSTADLALMSEKIKGTVTLADPAKITEAERKAEKRLSSLGRRVVWVDAKSDTVDLRGAVAGRTPTTIYLRRGQGNVKLAAVALHEVMHSARRTNRELADQLVEVFGRDRVLARGRQELELQSGAGVDVAWGEDAKIDEGLAGLLEDAAAANPEDAKSDNADLRQRILETPGLLDRLRVWLKQTLNSLAGKGSQEVVHAMRLLDRLEAQARKEASTRDTDSVAWAQTATGIAKKVDNTYGSSSASANQGAWDTMQNMRGDFINSGEEADYDPAELFRFAGPIPEVIRNAVSPRQLVKYGFRANVRGGRGEEAYNMISKKYGEQRYWEIVKGGTDQDSRKSRMASMRKAMEPEARFVAAFAELTQGKKPMPSVPQRVAGLGVGDVVRIQDQAARVDETDDGELILRGGHFNGLTLTGMDTIPVDARDGVWKYDEAGEAPRVNEPAGVGGDLPFSARKRESLLDDPDIVRAQSEYDAAKLQEDQSDDATWKDDPKMLRFNQMTRGYRNRSRRVVDQIRARLTKTGGAVKVKDTVYVVSKNTYPGGKPWRVSIFKTKEGSKPVAWGHSEHAKLDDPKSSGPYHSGAVQEVASMVGGKSDAVEDIRFSARKLELQGQTEQGTLGFSRGGMAPQAPAKSQRPEPRLTPEQRAELYPGIRQGESVRAYEKRMGTADTPSMFEDVPDRQLKQRPGEFDDAYSRRMALENARNVIDEPQKASAKDLNRAIGFLSRMRHGYVSHGISGKMDMDAVRFNVEMIDRDIESLKFWYKQKEKEEAKKPGMLFSARSALPPTIDVDGKQRPTTNSDGKPIARTAEEVRNFWKWFGDSKVVDASGKPLVVYHGSQRPERIGARFRKTRATSGPMAYFTDDPGIASNYSTNKKDTSLEMPESYSEWFTTKLPSERKPVLFEQVWNRLTPEQRASVAEKIVRVSNSDADGNEIDGLMLLPPGMTGMVDKSHWDHVLRREARGNYLTAARDIWLDSGNLFDQEEQFLKVLKLAGVPGEHQLVDPNATFSGVYSAYMKIESPLTTSKIDANFVASMQAAANKTRSRPQVYGADPWDKRTITPSDWMARLRDDVKNNTTHAWTSIPDWVTKQLKSMSYDGIHDQGGKNGGIGHNVFIPFEDTQIKSATGNRGTFDASEADIRFSARKRDDAISYLPPVDGSGHMTSDEPALIFEAKKGDASAGYALVVMPKGKAPYVGQITVAPELRRQGIATNLYAEIGKYLKANGLLPLRPSRDLSPGTQRIWDKRMASGVMFSARQPNLNEQDRADARTVGKLSQQAVEASQNADAEKSRRKAEVGGVKAQRDMERRAGQETQRELDRTVKLRDRRERALTNLIEQQQAANAQLNIELGDANDENTARRMAMKSMFGTIQDAQRQLRKAAATIQKATDKAKARADAEETAAKVRDAVVEIAKQLPPSIRGRMLTDVRDAADMRDLLGSEVVSTTKAGKRTGQTFGALGKAADLLIRYNGKEAWNTIEDITSRKSMASLTEERRKAITKRVAGADSLYRQTQASLAPASRADAAEELMAIADDVRAIVHEHRLENRIIKAGRLADAEIARDDVRKAIAAAKTVLPPNPRKPQAKVQPSRVRQWLHEGNYNLDTITKVLDGNMQGGGPVNKIVVEDIRAGMDRKFEVLEAATRVADAIAQEAGFDNLAHLLELASGSIGDGTTKTVNLRLAGKDHTLTWGQLAKVVSSLDDVSTLTDIQEGTPITFDDAPNAKGIRLRAEDIQTIRDAMPEQLREAVAGMKKIRDRLFPVAQSAQRVVTGREAPAQPGYEPRIRNMAQSQRVTDMDPMSVGFENKLIENSGFLQTRVRDLKTPLLMGDFFGDWQRSIHGMADVMHLMIPLRNAREVIMHESVNNAIADRWGDRAVESIKDRLRTVVRPPERSNFARVANQLARNVAVSRTALAPASLAISATASIPRLWAELGTARLLKGLKSIANTKVREDMLKASPWLRSRVTGAVSNIASTMPMLEGVVDSDWDKAAGERWRATRARVKRGGKAAIRQVILAASEARKGQGREALNQAGQVFTRSIPAITDEVRLQSWIDSKMAQIAWAAYDGDKAKAENALRLVLPSADPLAQTGWSHELNASGFGSVLGSFRSDANAAYNHISQAWMTDPKRGLRVTSALLAGALIAAVIKGLDRELKDELEGRENGRGVDAALLRFGQETLGAGFLSDKVFSAIDGIGGVSDTPVSGSVDQVAKSTSNIASTIYTAITSDDEAKVEKKLGTLLDDLLRLMEGAGTLTRNPVVGITPYARALAK